MALKVAELEGQISLETSKFTSGAKAVDDGLGKMTASMQKAQSVAEKNQAAMDKAFNRKWADIVAELDGKIGKTNQALDAHEKKLRQNAEASDEAAKGTKDFAGALSGVPGPIGEAASATSRYIALLTGPAGIVAGFAAVVTGAALLSKSMGDNIERLDNLSRQTGLSVDALEAFEHAARQSGEAPESLSMGLGKVNQAISDLLAGKDAAAKGFESIGVPFTQMVKDGAGVEQILEITARKLSAIQDPTARAAAGMDLFGLRGKAMQTVLDALAKDGIQGYIQALREAGIVTDAQTKAMAREFDVMWDSLMAKGVAYLRWFEGTFALSVFRTLEEWKALQQDWTLFFRPQELEQAGREGVQRRFAPERPPGWQGRENTPRIIAETEAQKKAAEDLVKALAAHAPENRRWEEWNDTIKEGVQLGADFAESIRQIEMKKLEVGLDGAVRHALDLEASLELGRDQTERFTLAGARFVSVLGDTIDQTGDLSTILRDETGEAIRDVNGALVMTETFTVRLTSGFQDLGRVSMETGEGFSILTEKMTNFDVEFARGQKLAENMPNTLRKNVVVLKTELPNALESFAAGFQKATDQIVENFASWESQGAGVAQSLHHGFSEVFFDAMEGDLKDADDAWKSFLRALEQQIADFLASEAISGLKNLASSAAPSGDGGGFFGGAIDFIKNIFSGGGSDAADAISSGGGGVDFPSAGGLTFTEQQASTRLSLEQARTGEVSQQLRLEEAKSKLGKGMGAVGSVVGGLGGGILGAGLGPAGALVGSIGGSLGLRAAMEALGDWMSEVLGWSKDLTTAQQVAMQAQIATLGLTTATVGLTTAELQAAVAGITAAHALDRNTEAVDGLTAATEGLTAAQTDLAIGVADVTSATVDTTSDLASFSDGLEGLGQGMAAAVEAANAAAATAQGAADSAAASADRAGFGADAGRGFGDRGTPGGAPDVTPDSPSTGGGGVGGGGVGAGGSPDPDQGGRDRFHGGWAPGFAPGGWVTAGAFGRDSVMARLARGEFVLNARAANFAPNFTEALNRNPAAALDSVAGGGDASGPAILAATIENNRLLRRQNELLERLARAPGTRRGAIG